MKHFYNFIVSLLFRNRAQRSVPIRLIRGRVYYIEALMKEGGGGDHISVGVKMRRTVKPIPRKYLYLVPPSKKIEKLCIVNSRKIYQLFVPTIHTNK